MARVRRVKNLGKPDINVETCKQILWRNAGLG
jgi:hypothetical protein